jgi:hypothetical protein
LFAAVDDPGEELLRPQNSPLLGIVFQCASPSLINLETDWFLNELIPTVCITSTHSVSIRSWIGNVIQL